MMIDPEQIKPEADLYSRQNRTIHKARGLLCMTLDDCRELARQMFGKPSISSLTLRERWELIEELKVKGARVKNPKLTDAPGSPRGSHSIPPANIMHGEELSASPGGCPVEEQEKVEDVYPNRLFYWDKRFPNRRPGYASNEELAWIQTLWELDFEDGRAGKNGLRGFIFRQTRNLEKGPVSDLAFLRSNQVQAILIPLKKRARERHRIKETMQQ